jgi:cytochrome c-type biogenesis protein CcmH
MSGVSASSRTVGWGLILVAVVALLILGAGTTPTEGLSEDRLYALAGEMKCLQCAGESVAGSQADIAVKMRTEIRQQMRRGRTDDEILGFFADRYGRRVLLNPSSEGVTSLVWILPVVVMGAGVAGLGLAFASWRRRRHETDETVVSADDRALVEEALAGAGPGGSAGDDRG